MNQYFEVNTFVLGDEKVRDGINLSLCGQRWDETLLNSANCVRIVSWRQEVWWYIECVSHLSQENTDVVGKTWSGIGCRSHVAYCLCISLVDSCTRWGTVFILISLSAIADIDGIVHKCRYRGLPSVFTIAIKEQVLRPIWQEFI